MSLQAPRYSGKGKEGGESALVNSAEGQSEGNEGRERWGCVQNDKLTPCHIK